MSGTKEETTQMHQSSITAEALEKWRERIGQKMRIRNQFNDLASKSAIRHFCDGIGDPNPLFRDEEYARKTRYGTLIAPPNFLYSVFPTWVLQGLPGVHAFHSGNDWTFYRPIYAGDVIRPECIFTGFDEKSSEFAGKMVLEYQEARYYNQRDELIGKARAWLVRAERHSARQKGKYHHIQLPHPWSEEELHKIEKQCAREQPRGATPRYWEDVKEGEEVDTIIKGPFGLTDMIAYCVGALPERIYAHGMAMRLYEDHPAWAFRDPNTYALEPIAGVHWNWEAAKAVGLPYPYDVGVQRNSWLIHFLINWMGDDGWIKKSYAEYRKFVYFSDVLWFKGTIKKKYIDEDGDCCVDIDHSAVNQRGEDSMPGHSTVCLPSREKNYWPLDNRLRK